MKRGIERWFVHSIHKRIVTIALGYPELIHNGKELVLIAALLATQLRAGETLKRGCPQKWMPFHIQHLEVAIRRELKLDRNGALYVRDLGISWV